MNHCGVIVRERVNERSADLKQASLRIKHIEKSEFALPVSLVRGFERIFHRGHHLALEGCYLLMCRCKRCMNLCELSGELYLHRLSFCLCPVECMHSCVNVALVAVKQRQVDAECKGQGIRVIFLKTLQPDFCFQIRYALRLLRRQRSTT